MTRAQQIAYQAVMLDRIYLSGLDHRAAFIHMMIGTAMVVVQKWMGQRRPHGKEADGQKGEPVAGPDIRKLPQHDRDHTAANWDFQSRSAEMLVAHCRPAQSPCNAYES